ncbi:MAG: DUF3822 family protein [Bacteroidales bacterium]|jgi:hypothetical protein|nr:DUF3822 family protein [Bacteroidales bacterium]
MQDFAFIDETLDINLTRSYYLSIQLSLDGLSFCILDPVRKKYIAFSHKIFDTDLSFDDYLNTIEEYLAKNDLLNQEYKISKLIWITNRNTLIPDSYFKPDNLKKYFEFNQKLDDLDEIHFNKLKYIDAYSIFAIPNQIANIFIKQFPGLKFYNQQTPFINRNLFKYHSESIKVFVNINDIFIDICLTKNGKLLLYNNFTYKTDPDIIYYIMYVFKQFDLNPENIELILSGLVDKKSSVYSNLKDFIGQVKFDKLSEDFSYSYTFNKNLSHSSTNLFNLQSCE